MLWKTYDYKEIIAIGDIHGSYETLLALIKKKSLNIPFFSLGDMIDRARRSRVVVELIKTEGNAILGNHELLIVVMEVNIN